MSAEAIAKTVRDMRSGRVHRLDEEGDMTWSVIAKTLHDVPVVDITTVYNEFHEGEKAHMLYEESVCRPPFWRAIYGFENSYGNVHLMYAVAVDRQESYYQRDGNTDDFEAMRWDTLNDVDWDRIRWIVWTTFWIGGAVENRTIHIPTAGPLMHVYIAVDEDGHPQDIHWRARDERYKDIFEGALSVLLQAMTVLNCRNVEVLEPTSRPRHERRRIERTGVTVSEIHVTKIGKYRRHDGPRRLGDGVPLSTVRGHVARYGDKYGRGKLFGKYEGEFWVPAHLRGTAEVGEVKHDYVVGE